MDKKRRILVRIVRIQCVQLRRSNIARWMTQAGVSGVSKRLGPIGQEPTGNRKIARQSSRSTFQKHPALLHRIDDHERHSSPPIGEQECRAGFEYAFRWIMRCNRIRTQGATFHHHGHADSVDRKSMVESLNVKVRRYVNLCELPVSESNRGESNLSRCEPLGSLWWRDQAPSANEVRGGCRQVGECCLLTRGVADDA